MDQEMTIDFLKSARLLPRVTAYALLGWSEKTGDQRRTTKRAPAYYKIGKEVFFAYDDVEKFLREKGAYVPAGVAAPADDAVVDTLLRGN